MARITIDQSKVKAAREAAKAIAKETNAALAPYSTVTVERAIARLFGIDGVNEGEVPLPNLLVEDLQNQELLESGVAYQLGRAAIGAKLSPQETAEKVMRGEMNWHSLPAVDDFALGLWLKDEAEKAVAKIRNNRLKREAMLAEYGDPEGALIYVIVATGNIFEDIVQAKAAAKQGADVIAVIRTTGQSLLDYVPYGATTEGFGGTMATQENFRLMRQALDEVAEETGHYTRLCNYCSGLCMPEIAVMGAFERLDMMLNDALYGILFRDINMRRTLIDQSFSRMINGAAGIIINTGEDNYLTTSDAYEEAHTVLASQFINEQFALEAGMPEELMGLGHAYEMEPDLENSFVYELAQAQQARQIFPYAPLKYMPPTKYMTGNIFRGHIQDALFNMVTTITKQRVHLLGMMTEAIHTPFMSDRALAIENARYIARAMKDLGDDLEFKKGGLIETRASQVLDEALDLLRKIEQEGLFATLEAGKFGGIKRPQDGGKGLKGVFPKAKEYQNPFPALLMAEEAEQRQAFERNR